MKDYIVFSLSQNLETASKLAKSMNIPIGDIKRTYFADGEVMVKTDSDVKNKDVVLIESTSKKAQEKMFELMLLLDSLNRGQPRSITLFIPYFGFSRQERSYDNEPVSCEVVAKILETASYDKLITYDLHHPLIKTFFKKSFETYLVTDLFKDYYEKYFLTHNIKKEDVVIVAPDHGANERVDALTNALGIHKIILNKVRPMPNVAEHLDIDNKDVKNKICIIFDDIIDTGGTIISSSKLLISKGAKAILVGATHGVFSHDSMSKLLEAPIENIVVTNTIEQEYDPRISVLDIYPIIHKYLNSK